MAGRRKMKSSMGRFLLILRQFLTRSAHRLVAEGPQVAQRLSRGGAAVSAAVSSTGEYSRVGFWECLPSRYIYIPTHPYYLNIYSPRLLDCHAQPEAAVLAHAQLGEHLLQTGRSVSRYI